MLSMRYTTMPQLPMIEANVRPPWADEMARLRYFLPGAFLFDREPFLLVAVHGEVERFVGAAALSLRPLQSLPVAWLCLRVEEVHTRTEIARELMNLALNEAWKGDAEHLYLAQTFDEDSDEARIFLEAGFEKESVTEVYELDSRALGERVERLYQRMRRSGLLPENVDVVALQPALIPKVREFLWQHMPHSASLLALETAGHRPENSLALFINDELKGVLLCRREGRVGYIGLRVVAPELRAGTGWANLVLLHASTSSGLRTGLEVSHFEFDPKLHPDTREFAKAADARQVGRRLLLRMKRPENAD
jgi:N-acetylglutamate synthase-like GNAT family acetyltransferase